MGAPQLRNDLGHELEVSVVVDEKKTVLDGGLCDQTVHRASGRHARSSTLEVEVPGARVGRDRVSRMIEALSREVEFEPIEGRLRPVIMTPVIAGFRDRATEDIFDGRDSRSARRALPRSLWPRATRRLDQLNRVRSLDELRIPPGNRLEKLRRDRAGQLSIRINDHYRICFRWEAGDAHQVEITDYH